MYVRTYTVLTLPYGDYLFVSSRMKPFTWAVFATRTIELLKGDVSVFITNLPVAFRIHDPGNQEGENQITKHSVVRFGWDSGEER